MTIREALNWAAAQFLSDTAKLDAEVLLAAALNRDRTYLYTWPERRPEQTQQPLWQSWVARRSTGEPIAHILGQREFWSLTLEVNPCTLIPRPDSEVLIEAVLERVPQPQQMQLQFLDLGTGTGALALALAKEFPRSRVLATDFSSQAVALAERNRLRHQLHNMQCLKSNWFTEIQGEFDWIISNPPYIDAEDPHLDQGDLRFEPRSALVAEQQGLADIAHIVHTAPTYLRERGQLLLEHGWQQHESVQKLLGENGFTDIYTQFDYAGNPRATGGQRAKS